MTNVTHKLDALIAMPPSRTSCEAAWRCTCGKTGKSRVHRPPGMTDQQVRQNAESKARLAFRTHKWRSKIR